MSAHQQRPQQQTHLAAKKTEIDGKISELKNKQHDETLSRSQNKSKQNDIRNKINANIEKNKSRTGTLTKLKEYSQKLDRIVTNRKSTSMEIRSRIQQLFQKAPWKKPPSKTMHNHINESQFVQHDISPYKSPPHPVCSDSSQSSLCYPQWVAILCQTPAVTNFVIWLTTKVRGEGGMCMHIYAYIICRVAVM